MKVKRIFQYLIMAILSFVFLFPIIWSVLSSFKTEDKIVAFPPEILPNPFILINYANTLQKYPYLGWMFNSFIVTVLSTLLVLILSSLAAYAFARLEFKFKNILFLLVTAMMLIPIQGYMIPLFKMVTFLGMRGKFEQSALGIILPAGANITSLFILTSFFKQIPLSLEEAARIDGCKDFRIFSTIIIPLSKEALSAVGILTFISNWNAFLWPSIILSGDKSLTLPVALTKYFGAAANDAAFRYGPSLAGACMAIIPTIVLFLFLQRYFVEGIASSGIKG